MLGWLISPFQHFKVVFKAKGLTSKSLLSYSNSFIKESCGMLKELNAIHMGIMESVSAWQEANMAIYSSESFGIK